MTWFKNCRVFELIEPVAKDAQALSNALQTFAFTPCEAFESKRLGWVSPAPFLNPEALVYEHQGRLAMTLAIEDKILPATVIQHTLTEKTEQAEVREGRRLSKRERVQLKTEVINDLLPRAFSKYQHIMGYIDTKLNIILVNTSSAQVAETFSIALRQALGSLKIRLPDVSQAPVLMTDWVAHAQLPQGFEVDDMCVIQDGLETGGVIRCQNQNLFAQDIQALMGQGREVVALRMVWQEQIRFVLKQDGVIQGIKFLDSVLKYAQETNPESQAEQFITDFTIMSESLSQLVAELMQVITAKASVKSKAKEFEAVYGE